MRRLPRALWLSYGESWRDKASPHRDFRLRGALVEGLKFSSLSGTLETLMPSGLPCGRRNQRKWQWPHLTPASTMDRLDPSLRERVRAAAEEFDEAFEAAMAQRS